MTHDAVDYARLIRQLEACANVKLVDAARAEVENYLGDRHPQEAKSITGDFCRQRNPPKNILGGLMEIVEDRLAQTRTRVTIRDYSSHKQAGTLPAGKQCTCRKCGGIVNVTYSWSVPREQLSHEWRVWAHLDCQNPECDVKTAVLSDPVADGNPLTYEMWHGRSAPAQRKKRLQPTPHWADK